MPLISIVVPVYKVESYLSRCVNSILAQTFSDFELVLVDDGSPDNCGKICDEYAEKDGRIQVIHQENGGLSAARNAGIDWVFANSDSEYLTFIDSDDWVHPRYLELLYRALTEYYVEISQCMVKRTNKKREDHIVSDSIICVTPEEQYSEWYSPFACGKLYKRELFNTLRYPEGLLFEDIAIWYKLLFSIKKIAIVKSELYYYFQNDEGITGSTWTPAKLSQVKSWDEQIEFARKYGSEPVLQTALRRGCWVYRHQWEEIEESDRISHKEKNKYKKLIIKKIRSVLQINKKELKEMGLYNIYFGFAFPKLDWIKWTAIGIIGKIKRRNE